MIRLSLESWSGFQLAGFCCYDEVQMTSLGDMPFSTTYSLKSGGQVKAQNHPSLAAASYTSYSFGATRRLRHTVLCCQTFLQDVELKQPATGPVEGALCVYCEHRREWYG